MISIPGCDTVSDMVFPVVTLTQNNDPLVVTISLLSPHAIPLGPIQELAGFSKAALCF
jgi:hypothetical protein